LLLISLATEPVRIASVWRRVLSSPRRSRLVQPEGSGEAAIHQDGSRIYTDTAEEVPFRHARSTFQYGQEPRLISIDVTTVLKKAENAITMDVKGVWRGHGFVEMLRRPVRDLAGATAHL